MTTNKAVAAAVALVAAGRYNPNQPRDKEGQWTRYGTGFGGPSAHPDRRVEPTSSLTLDDFKDRERLRSVVKDLWGPDAVIKDVLGPSNGGTASFVTVGGTIRNKFGDTVGHFERKLNYVNGKVDVDHTSLIIDPVYQGRGIGSAWNAHAIERYRALGIDQVRVHAGEPIGGYAWAREGFRAFSPWNQNINEGSRVAMANVLKQSNGKLRELHAQGKISDEHYKVAKKELTALKRALDAGEDVQPIHVASIGEDTMRFRGETPEGGRYDTWPGKEALIGSDWNGIYFFDANNAAITAAAQICEHGMFACYEASCRPPTSGGTGGSSPKGGSKAKATAAPKNAPVTAFGRAIRDAIANDPDLAPLTGSGRAKAKAEAEAHGRMRDEQYIQELYGPGKSPRDSVLPRSFNVFIDPSKMSPSSGLIQDPEVRESHERVREAINNAHNIRQSDYIPRNAEEQMIKDLITKRLDTDVYEEVRVSNEYGIGVSVWAQPKTGFTPEVWSSTEQAVGRIGKMIDDEIESRIEAKFDGDAVKRIHEDAMNTALTILRRENPDARIEDIVIQRTSDGRVHANATFPQTNAPTLEQIRANPELANHRMARYSPAVINDLTSHIRETGVSSPSLAQEMIARRWQLHQGVFKEVMGEVRELGGEHKGTPRHRDPKYAGSLSTNQQITRALEVYPKDWIDVSSADRELVFRQTTGRAHYQHMKAKGTKAVSELTLDGSVGTAIHEFAHRFEATVPSVLQLERIFYDRRTAGEGLKRMGRGYDRDEVTREDEFFNPYAGKDYKGRAYELLSLGYETLQTRTGYAKVDPEYRAFVLGTVATAYRLDL